jgi:hypothetical protein
VSQLIWIEPQVVNKWFSICQASRPEFGTVGQRDIGLAGAVPAATERLQGKIRLAPGSCLIFWGHNHR